MMFLGREALCRLLLVLASMVVGFSPLLIAVGCTYVEKGGDSDKVTTTTICILAMCETADRVDRVGNPSAISSEINEDVEEEVNTAQGEEGQLAVDPTGL